MATLLERGAGKVVRVVRRRLRCRAHADLRFCVGTFHKSGTVLWDNILRELERDFGLTVWRSDPLRQEPRPAAMNAEFNWHTRFRTDMAPPRGAAPTVIVARDPRDLLISAARYHLRAEEPWLRNPEHEPAAAWRSLGATYQEAIRAVDDPGARILFEMEHATGVEIRAMRDAPLDHPAVRLTRLETLMRDTELVEFRACFEHLGFHGALLQAALDAADRNSIFSKRFGGSAHIQSGKSEEWRALFDNRLHAAFRARFGDVIERLGYPPA